MNRVCFTRNTISVLFLLLIEWKLFLHQSFSVYIKFRTGNTFGSKWMQIKYYLYTYGFIESCFHSWTCEVNFTLKTEVSWRVHYYIIFERLRCIFSLSLILHLFYLWLNWSNASRPFVPLWSTCSNIPLELEGATATDYIDLMLAVGLNLKRIINKSLAYVQHCSVTGNVNKIWPITIYRHNIHRYTYIKIRGKYIGHSTIHRKWVDKYFWMSVWNKPKML